MVSLKFASIVIFATALLTSARSVHTSDIDPKSFGYLGDIGKTIVCVSCQTIQSFMWTRSQVALDKVVVALPGKNKFTEALVCRRTTHFVTTADIGFTGYRG